jgi:acetoin utilization deacetylase AcuC-like enzyme
LSEDAYASMVQTLVAALGPEVPIGIVLEGGYDLHGLEQSLRAAVEGLFTRAPATPRAAEVRARHEHDLAQAEAAARCHWKLG